MVALFILIIEIIFKRHKEQLEKDNEISRAALIHWKRRVAVRIIYKILLFFFSKFYF